MTERHIFSASQISIEYLTQFVNGKILLMNEGLQQRTFYTIWKVTPADKEKILETKFENWTIEFEDEDATTAVHFTRK